MLHCLQTVIEKDAVVMCADKDVKVSQRDKQEGGLLMTML